jgi:hypothetical protein
VGLLFSASSAFAAAPWWGLSSGSWPTNLHSGVAQDEVQELAVSATGGQFVVVDETGGFHFRFFNWNATHEAVQAALEEEEMYGKGNVEVGGGPAVGENCEAGCKPYVITFAGKLAGQPVPPSPLTAAFSSAQLSCEGENCKHEATLTERTKGRADGTLVVTAENTGDAWIDASVTPVVVEDTLPEDLEAVPPIKAAPSAGETFAGPVECSLPTPHHVRCVYEGTFPGKFGEIEPKALQPYKSIDLYIPVKTAGTLSIEPNVVNVSGGGANPATLTEPIHAGASSPFGVADYKMAAEEEGGASSTQAGVHPFGLTTTVVISTSEAAAEPSAQQPAALAKDLTVELPPGLIGNPTPLPQCPDAVFTADEAVEGDAHNICPDDTALGEATIMYNAGDGVNHITVPVFNLEPRLGEPARFGFELPFVKARVYLDTAVRSGGDYGVTVKVSNITQIAGFMASRLTFWGVPADPAHDVSRGWRCGSFETLPSERARRCPARVASTPPFLSLPTSCTGPMRTTVQADSWLEPHPSPAQSSQAPLFAEYEMGGLDGCNRLQFSPEVRVTPDATEASRPTGLNVDVHVAQASVLNPEGLAESNVKDITVALPPGVAVNPSAGDGRLACSEGLAGFTGLGELDPVGEPGNKTALFTATPKPPFESPEPGLNTCENASKIGEFTIRSPLLPATQPLKGFAYLATQNQNPFGSLIALYLIAEEPVSGTLVKLTGETRLCQGPGELIDGVTCQAVGQIIATILNNPQLAFEDGEFHFFGGERAPLATPARCGPYTTSASFVPWSVQPGEAPRTSSSTFNVTEGPNHTPCPGASLPFSPSLTGGATNVNAGAFSPFTATMSRKDGEQNLQSLEVHLPPGLSGVLSGVELCPEPQANEGKCAPNSLIGETTVSVGVGGDPFTVSGGKFYLTGPYNGSGSCKVTEPGCAPFGLTFEVPAKAGPFDLKRNSANPAGENACDCVIVRGKIEINRLTAALTITSDPPGSPYAIPTSIEGIPLEIQHVNAITTRNNFQFNPTNCSKMEFTGTIHSSENATDTIGVPFQVTNCRSLSFTPKFKVSTSAHTSKADGASLTTTVTEPPGSLGTQANLAKVKVELPKQLPSRLTTLQKACTAAQFNANPAGCPAASVIGHATVHTPLLPVPLTGPAIFVSHGGEAFPSLEIVLQGDNFTIDLVGDTFISKTGVTSTTFKTVPDQPFSTFELTLPTGKFSALGANLPARAHASFCGQKLTMPTEMVAQNGMEIHQNTQVAVTGCKKPKKAKKKHAHRAKHHGQRAGHRAKRKN